MDESFRGRNSVNHNLPKPIAFNCWKHHMGYIKDALISNDLCNFSHLNIHEIIQFIGDSNVDFYYGDLDTISISDQIICRITAEIDLNIDNFTEWVSSKGRDYKEIVLSDGSSWTIRLGQIDNRFIHIHPSRYSKKTLRVKSSTLKTAVAFFFNFGFSTENISVEKINYIRHKIVKLPLFKSNSSLAALSRVVGVFSLD
ncbi:MAG: hypothetical protein HXX16_07905 [Bacteroidales bacterium]|nr:hypothetical protein [Bacteroidales bacterium]